MRRSLLRSAVALVASAALSDAASTAVDPFGHGLRRFFFFPENFTQLNHGAYGGTPRPVLESQYGYMQKMEQNINEFMNGATGYRACILEARNALSGMANAPVNDTVLVDNASEAINDLLRNFEPPLSADEYILDLSTGYGPFQALYAWLGERLGVQTLTVPIAWPVTGPESFVDPVRTALQSNASSINIRVAVISQISAYPAVTLPIKELVEVSSTLSFKSELLRSKTHSH